MATQTTFNNSCVQSHQFSSGIAAAAASGAMIPDAKEALALATIPSVGISQSNKTEGGRRNDRLLQNDPSKMQGVNSGTLVDLIR